MIQIMLNRVSKHLIVVLAFIASGADTFAQESSLFRRPGANSPLAATVNSNGSNAYPQGALVPLDRPRPPGVPMAAQLSAPGLEPLPVYPSGDVGLASASWTYTPANPLRTFRVQDIVTIRVDEIARMQADGANNSRRNGLYDAVLKEWVQFREGSLGPAGQSDGDPRIDGQTNQLYRANAMLQTRESLAFNVAAKVVDIQPNGNLVLEARKTILLNDNRWETSLTGICRAQDIAPDNVVLSRDLLDLEIAKKETGELRDGYRRGWLTRWINEFNPF